ncbi:MAG: MogA/MoaB family molybdenum cofactor biosynthesis protein [Gemmatales bacterium]|nr:MogA/MoaB family molybdenum cofactor biosynthesis protein [Gemmatales bacterium]MDW8388073.1 MogA/MoaB family molybdenum cofactor biosynthesis protein [Gemmatales bacterium]
MCAVVTVSDTRSENDDQSGAIIRQLLSDAGLTVAAYCILKDEPDQIRAFLQETANASQVQAVLLNGGTGISRRDSTFEAMSGLLEKRLDGFGELFRMLSWYEIGAAAMLSRAIAGVYRGLVIFAMPGSPNAVRLAMEKLILPELAHVVWELRKQSA